MTSFHCGVLLWSLVCKLLSWRPHVLTPGRVITEPHPVVVCITRLFKLWDFDSAVLVLNLLLADYSHIVCFLWIHAVSCWVTPPISPLSSPLQVSPVLSCPPERHGGGTAASRWASDPTALYRNSEERSEQRSDSELRERRFSNLLHSRGVSHRQLELWSGGGISFIVFNRIVHECKRPNGDWRTNGANSSFTEERGAAVN